MGNNVLLVFFSAIAVAMGGLFAGAETGMYRLSLLRLRMGVEKKHLPFVILGRCLHDSPGLLLTLLIGTNLSHYLTTSIVTSMFLSSAGSEHKAEMYATFVTVPILFVFAELIPKNIFFYSADMLMPYVSPLLYLLHRILTLSGIVPLLKRISALFARLTGLVADSKSVMTSVQRHKVQALLREIHEEGILSSVQSDIVNRLVGISHVRLRAVMIPIHDVETVKIDSDRSALLNRLRKCAFTRLPVVEGQVANVVGFVSMYEVLSQSREFADLRDFVKPIVRLDADMTVTDAIGIMQKDNLKIVLVTRAARGGRERPIGIATMKDLVEELLGELAEW